MERPAFELPPLYPILDTIILQRAGLRMDAYAEGLRQAGVRFLQYRDKVESDDAVLARARDLRSIFPVRETTLVLNDRPHLLEASGFDGVHIGQEDLPPEEARRRVGPDKIIGLSTHNSVQLISAAEASVDYIAIGPVFGTQSKQNPDPVVGLAGVREARRLTNKPLVAIGGITPVNARAVLDAGADSIALISALLPFDRGSTAKVIEDFLARIG